MDRYWTREGEDQMEENHQRAVPARQDLARAVALVQKFQSAAGEYFSKRPFIMGAAPSRDNSDEDLYRFRLTRRIPRALHSHARRSLRALRPLAEALDASEHSLLRKLSEHRRSRWRALLIPGVRAGTVLDMDGQFHSPAASLDAPVWNARKREVTVVRRDPGIEFHGRMEVKFQLEFADAVDLQAQSAIVLLGAALREAELLIDGMEESSDSAAPGFSSPGQAGRHDATDAPRNQNRN